MLAIPVADLMNSTYVYIGVVCPDICEYKIKADYESTINIIMDNTAMMRLTNTSTTKVFTFKHQNNSRFFEIYGFGYPSDFQMDIRYVVGQKTENSVNTQASWYSGYSAIVDTDIYYDCDKCYYKIIVTGDVGVYALIGVRNVNITSELKTEEHVFGSLLTDMSDCYLFGANHPLGDYILNGNSYHDTITFAIKSKREEAVPVKSYSFKQNIVLKLNSEELKNKYLCVETVGGYSIASYMFILIKEEKMQNYQGKFVLFHGVPLQGYLMGGQVTTYSLFGNSVSGNVNIGLQVYSGNPVLYSYFCVTSQECFFDQQKIGIYQDRLIKTSKVGDHYNINIPPEANQCTNLKPPNDKTPIWSLCKVMAVVNHYISSILCNKKNPLLHRRPLYNYDLFINIIIINMNIEFDNLVIDLNISDFLNNSTDISMAQSRVIYILI